MAQHNPADDPSRPETPGQSQERAQGRSPQYQRYEQRPDPSTFNEHSMQEALMQTLDKYGIRDKALIRDLLDNFAQYATPPMARRTRELQFHNGVLYMTIPDPAWRQQVLMHRSEIIRSLNRQLGKDLIQDLALG
jgi:predicted nucleic acid-binding Zn ribbon protein